MLAASGCHSKELAKVNIANVAYAGPLPPSVVAAGSFEISSGFPIAAFSGAITGLLPTPGPIALLQVPYEGGLPLSCSPVDGDSCLGLFDYNDAYAPDLLSNLVDMSQTFPGLKNAIVDGKITSAAMQYMGVKVPPIELVNSLVPSSGSVTFHVDFGGYVAVELQKQVVTKSNEDGTWEIDWASKEDADANFKDIPGVYVPLSIVPEAPLTADLSCTCDGPLWSGKAHASNPAIQQACDDLGKLFCLVYPTNLPGWSEQCEQVKWHVKVNHLPLRVGFALSAGPVGSVWWTPQLFPGARSFSPEVNLSVRPVAASMPWMLWKNGDDAAVDADTDHDIAVSVTTACSLPTAWAVCSALALTKGLAGCGDLIALLSTKSIQAEVSASLVMAVEPEVKQLLSPAKDPLPAPCVFPFWPASLSNPSPGECSLDDVMRAIRASLAYQKLDWFLSPFGPYPMGGGILPVTKVTATPASGAPGTPTTIKIEFDNDLDGDGVRTDEDNCPFDKNPEQWDSDQDGHGDPCDDCIFDHDNDADGDGVCGDVDNCREVFNPTQANCNAMSEELFKGEELGDACDPVPCPDHWLDPVLVEETCPPVCTEQDKLDGKCPAGCPPELPPYWKMTMVCPHTKETTVDIRALMSHPHPTVLHSVEETGYVSSPIRLCQKQPGKSFFCITPLDLQAAGEEDHECWDPLPKTPTKCENPEREWHRFHRMVVGKQLGKWKSPNSPGFLAKYSQGCWDYSPKYTPRWNFAGDFDRWVNGTSPALIEGVSTGLELAGSVWMKANTPIGSLLDVGTGLHLAEQPARLDEQLDIGSGQGADVSPVAPGECVACKFSHIETWGLYPDSPPDDEPLPPGDSPDANSNEPASPARSSYLVWRPAATPVAKAFRRYEASRLEASYVGLLEPAAAGALSPSKNCGSQIVTDQLGSKLLAALGDSSLLWVNAAEPFTVQGAGPAFPLAVALPAVGGDDVIDAVTTDGARLLANGDRTACDPSDQQQCPSCPSGWCDASGVCCDIPCLLDADCPSGYCDPAGGACRLGPRQGSPHAVRYAAVLSRVERGVFVLGGDDPETGEPTGEAWFTLLDGQDWSRVPLGFDLGRVLAATYGFATDELFILDESEGEVRLWAVGTDTHAVRQLGTWERQGGFDRYWLTIDRDGELLLTASRLGPRKVGHPPFWHQQRAERLLGRLARLWKVPGWQKLSLPVCRLVGKMKHQELHVPPHQLEKLLAQGARLGPCVGHAIARFEVTGGEAAVAGMRLGGQPLVLPPLVDGDGYTLVGRKGSGPKVQAERARELDLSAVEPELLAMLF